MSNITQTPKKPKTKNHQTAIPPRPRPKTEPGHTTIDVLIVRAGVLCVLGLDYAPTIALARQFANLAERRIEQ